jgi:beta-glucosidase
MNAFNTYDGIPASANTFLLRKILRGEWQFNGLVVSDWGSFSGMIDYGVAKDAEAAAQMALQAGSDVDMESNVYVEGLPKLAEKNALDMTLLNESVTRVLQLKYDLGLFSDPYRYINAEREREKIFNQEHLAIARDVARKSIVLLKNEHNILPLKGSEKRIAVIGPLADAPEHMNGFWYAAGKKTDPISLLTALKSRANVNMAIDFAKGCEIEKRDEQLLQQALEIAKNAEIIIVAVGEDSEKTGEASSKTNLNLSGAQQELLRELHKIGKPTIMVLMNGRPLTIDWEVQHIPAIVEAWFLGTQAGPAIADVLFGEYNPSAKLTMTFPRSVGQIPIFYNQKRVSREFNANSRWVSKYVDSPNEPLFPFGYGLSYSTFKYGEIKLSATKMAINETLTASITVENTSPYFGEEIVQMYVQDTIASVVPAYKNLKGFAKIGLNPGETKTVSFSISKEHLSFIGKNLLPVVEAGEFILHLGPNSELTQKVSFILEEAPN